jgi:hypothetical protein
MHTTTHRSETVGQLVLVDVDPTRQQVNRAIAGFLAGYSGATLRPTASTSGNGSAGSTASHADPRTTMRYDRGRGSLDRHATYIVSTFLAGASR